MGKYKIIKKEYKTVYENDVKKEVEYFIKKRTFLIFWKYVSKGRENESFFYYPIVFKDILSAIKYVKKLEDYDNGNL